MSKKALIISVKKFNKIEMKILENIPIELESFWIFFFFDKEKSCPNFGEER